MSEPNPQFTFERLEMEIRRAYFSRPLENLFDNRFGSGELACSKELTDLLS